MTRFPYAYRSANIVVSGDSQVIRLPKELWLETDTVQIERMGGGLLIIDPNKEAARFKALRKLYGSCPDFPEVETA